MAKDSKEIENDSYCQMWPFNVITAVMEGEIAMNFYQDQGMWKIILSFRESISESLYFYLFSLCLQINTFLLVPMKDYILWIWTRYMNQVWNWWVCDYRQAQKMFNDLNYSFKYFCVIYSRSLIYLSRSNPCSRLYAMFITYTWKCTTFLFDFVLFLLDSFMQGDVFGFMW